MKKILIVDDHTMFRQAVEAILMDRMPAGSIKCDDAYNAETARKKLSANKYHLILLDISMPGISGMELLPELRANYPKIPVLVLSMYPDQQFALQALRLGASGYMTKQKAADELLAAVQGILAGERYVSVSFSKLLLDHVLRYNVVHEPLHARLSRRELEVFKQIATGKTQKLIAEELGLSIKTISTYKSRLNIKMGFKNSASLIRYALQHQL
jgi:two-component system, NarL family, invasion response regulator UvrY